MKRRADNFTSNARDTFGAKLAAQIAHEAPSINDTKSTLKRV